MSKVRSNGTTYTFGFSAAETARGGERASAVTLRPGPASAVRAGFVSVALFASLAIVNVRAGALFVATLVRPREAVGGHDVGEEPAAPQATPRSWRFRVGTVVATAEAVPSAQAQAQARAGPGASPFQLGATIGVIERLLIVTFVFLYN